ncbi:hypothetical protein [Chryseobacterium sp. JK1]|uniref:hypothetical protein n=1 Tax=Chryseobacterium sp. JK1 TaxID=874294 RepID=UPI003D68246B
METGLARIKKLLLSLLILLISSCNNKKINGDDASGSVAESKNNKVFLKEFIPQNRIIDSLEDYAIDECWLEQRWNYKNSNLDINKLSGYRLVLKVNKKSKNVFINSNIDVNSQITSDFGYGIPFLRIMDLKDDQIKDSLLLSFHLNGKKKKILLITVK